jgi:hypothetical protein
MSEMRASSSSTSPPIRARIGGLGLCALNPGLVESTETSPLCSVTAPIAISALLIGHGDFEAIVGPTAPLCARSVFLHVVVEKPSDGALARYSCTHHHARHLNPGARIMAAIISAQCAARVAPSKATTARKSAFSGKSVQARSVSLAAPRAARFGVFAADAPAKKAAAKEEEKPWSPPKLNPNTPSPIFGGSTGGLLRKAQVRNEHGRAKSSP